MVDDNFSASNLIVALNKREDELINGALAAWMVMIYLSPLTLPPYPINYKISPYMFFSLQNLPLPTLKTIASEFMQNEELAAAIEKSLNAPKAGQVKLHPFFTNFH
jgi:hypothetical protein